jgi:adenosine kinase
VHECLVVTGSIAFDYLMSFPGKFTEHFLPEHMHRVSLSFLVDSMDKRRGGCAPNIAYTLALLGERPRLMATAGQDFGDYRPGSRRPASTRRSSRSWTASSRRRSSAAPTRHNNQIASFYTGAMANAGELSFRTGPGSAARTWRSSRRTIRGRWCSTPRSASTLGIPYIWDPGQQCARMTATS